MAKLVVNRFANREETEQEYLRQADGYAESLRLRYITPGAGQTMTYEAKYQEAVRYLQQRSDERLYWLPAEAEALGKTVDGLAHEVVSARQQWEQLGVLIECERLKAKKVVRESASPQEMWQALANFRSAMESALP